ncbi:hypothetical protein [Streptomyces sp. IBSBF 2435]|uniref:hypothetical protein n=1 Tax=Streptomyces sp. IBSBF 2435 TaxID=2903531 RepID=UPI002FDC237E
MRSTRRPPAALGALALAVAVGALGACTGGGTDNASSDSKSARLNAGTVSPAPPGKYRTLPQPCIAVDLDTLKALVPGGLDYSGTESLTYDTDRRVGCSWRATTPDGSSRSLAIDLERVVSYDPAVSDEVEAKSDFDDQAATASIPPLPLPGSTTTTSPPTTQTSGTTGTSGTGAPTGPAGNSADLAPRRLTDVGNAAFINDVPATKKGGVARRDVTLVFRTANVVVNIRYTQSSPADAAPPQSADLQGGAQKVAEQLERRVES